MTDHQPIIRLLFVRVYVSCFQLPSSLMRPVYFLRLARRDQVHLWALWRHLVGLTWNHIFTIVQLNPQLLAMITRVHLFLQFPNLYIRFAQTYQTSIRQLSYIQILHFKPFSGSSVQYVSSVSSFA